MDISVEAPVAVVTVYAERALVQRRATVHVDAAGEHTIKIGGLLQTLARNSLRAQGRGPAGTRILGIEQENEIHTDPPVEQVQTLLQEITGLQRELERIEARKKIIEEQREWLRTLGEQSARRLANGIAAATAKPEDASALFAYTSEEADRLVGSLLDLQSQGEERTRELRARQRKVHELRSSAAPDRMAASVRIEVPAPGDLEIELSYLIGPASWQPRYEARVDIGESRVQLVEEALVSQLTGEEWRAVSLSLSTAQPNAAVSLPDEPDPWYIDVQAPAPVAVPQSMERAAHAVRRATVLGGQRDVGPVSNAVESGFKELMAAEAPRAALEEAETAAAPVDRSGAAQVFHLPGGIDIPSDGAPHTVSLGEHGLPCRLEYVAAPVIAPGAHLRALVTNTTGTVLLPGQLHVFHAGPANDEYVGATQLGLSAEDSEIKLYLGVDDNVTVKRELIERDTDKGSLLQSGMRRITYGYRVKLANRTSLPQRVILLDRLPVTRHERVKLKVLDLRPQPAARTRLEQLTWELQLAPGQEQRIEWRFVIEAPADVSVTGLP